MGTFWVNKWRSVRPSLRIHCLSSWKIQTKNNSFCSGTLLVKMAHSSMFTSCQLMMMMSRTFKSCRRPWNLKRDQWIKKRKKSWWCPASREPLNIAMIWASANKWAFLKFQKPTQSKTKTMWTVKGTMNSREWLISKKTVSSWSIHSKTASSTMAIICWKKSSKWSHIQQ